VSLLFLAHRAPFAPDRGDRIRSYHVLRHLAAQGPVHLVTFADRDEPVPDLGLASCTVLPLRKSRGRALIEAVASGRPVSLAAFADGAFSRAVDDVMAAHAPDAAYVFSGQMAQYVPPAMPFVMDFVDVDSAKFAALAKGAMAPLYAREARLLGRFERDVAERAAASLFVNRAEAALFGEAPRVAVVENGIDTAFFRPGVVTAEPEGAAIVFTGQMDYAPNIDAVRWFVGEVLPLVRRQRPAARFAIVGRAPTAAVRALGEQPGVVVTGEVADVRGWLGAARVAVAPLRIARGVQNKVLEAMAMALPVVATAAAAEGIDDAGTIAVADDPRDFAAAVVAALDDAGDRGERGRAQVIWRYGWEAALAPLGDLLRHAGLVPASTSPQAPNREDAQSGGCRDEPGMTG
jgi:sugar transferase (PEP-CTERM/EpsH1 system associated)